MPSLEGTLKFYVTIIGANFLPSLILFWLVKKYCAKKFLPYEIRILKHSLLFSCVVAVAVFFGVPYSIINSAVWLAIIATIIAYILF